MPNTYHLFPGLKQILEDKRIMKFGMPEFEYPKYLMAEQFVLDMRGYNDETDEQIYNTYEDLREMGLDKPPYDNFVLHLLSDITIPNLVTFYFSDFKGENEKGERIYLLSPSREKAIASSENLKIGDNKELLEKLSKIAGANLIVMLATRNIVKERHEAKTSQMPVNGKPHKKGSGGYTLLRPPEAHEIKDGTGTHASPRPHFRRGHIRKLHPEDKTRWIFVSPCFVNGEPEVARKAYLVA